MSTFDEIYNERAAEYDELVSHEDYQNNLPAVLNSLFDFAGKTVIELGCGTGRVTKLYIEKAKSARCYDLSEHMLSRAKENLSEYAPRVDFTPCDNLAIDALEGMADFVIEGWSFGHSVSDSDRGGDAAVHYLVEQTRRLLKVGGTAIFIETLGTDAAFPRAPSPALERFYHLLETVYSFKKETVATDYRFGDAGEAARIMGGFFGDNMRKSIQSRQDSVIREFTGVWHKQY